MTSTFFIYSNMNESSMELDLIYMRRALQLAVHGCQSASPNPMVGAVIVDADGRIIGEGWHRKCGGPHAEVNAVNDADHRGVADRLSHSTIYVTLEPCAHHGKTPPCASLLVGRKFRRVVVGCIDPFSKVSGRGIAILREAGIDVTVGILEKECKAVNRHFFTAHTLGRPFIILKWAQSADGFIDRIRTSADEPAERFSSAVTATLVHQLRAQVDAIAVGTRTAMLDRPRLDARLWPGGDAPQRVSFDSSQPLLSQLQQLYASGITSLLVEGGARLLQSFIDADLFDEIRIEELPFQLGEGVAAPKLPARHPAD